MQIKLQVPIEDLFPGERATFDRLTEILTILKRTDTLFWIARVNLILSNPNNEDELDKQRYIAQTFLSTEELKRLDLFVQQHSLEKISLIQRSALLELARWVLVLCEDDPDALETFNSSDTRTCFIKSVLISGKLWSDRVYQDGITSENYKYLPILRKNVEHNRLSDPYWRSIARGKYLFTKCMEEFYPSIYDEFLTATKLTIDEYYACVVMILSQYCDVTPQMVKEDNNKCGGFPIGSMLDYSTEQAKEVMRKYFSYDAQTTKMAATHLRAISPPMLDPRNEFDANVFIDHPIIKSDGKHNMGIVMDLVSYSKKATMAPFLVLKKFYGDKSDKTERLKRALGHAFEKNYVHNILKTMFENEKQGELIISPKLHRSGGTGSEEIELSDFAVVQNSDLILIETKAVLMPEEKIQPTAPGSYKREILSKYGRTSEKHATGVGQLINAINRLTDRCWETSDIDIKKIRNVYCILLCFDELMPIFGQIGLLVEKFQNALQSSYMYPGTSYMQKGRLICAPLVVMSVVELENLHGSAQHFSFFNLIADYARNLYDRPDSISHFILSQRENQKYGFYYNRPMFDRMIEELYAAGNLFFGISRMAKDNKSTS